MGQGSILVPSVSILVIAVAQPGKRQVSFLQISPSATKIELRPAELAFSHSPSAELAFRKPNLGFCKPQVCAGPARPLQKPSLGVLWLHELQLWTWYSRHRRAATAAPPPLPRRRPAPCFVSNGEASYAPQDGARGHTHCFHVAPSKLACSRAGHYARSGPHSPRLVRMLACSSRVTLQLPCSSRAPKF